MVSEGYNTGAEDLYTLVSEGYYRGRRIYGKQRMP